jgi:large subunit ribosomal protein L23
MPQVSDVIKGIRQTEKGTRLERLRQYVLQVAKDANKIQIKQAAEARFQVSVVKVNTQVYQGKWKRLTGRWGQRADWKKAIITVAEGQKIELK